MSCISVATEDRDVLEGHLVTIARNTLLLQHLTCASLAECKEVCKAACDMLSLFSSRLWCLLTHKVFELDVLLSVQSLFQAPHLVPLFLVDGLHGEMSSPVSHELVRVEVRSLKLPQRWKVIQDCLDSTTHEHATIMTHHALVSISERLV